MKKSTKNKVVKKHKTVVKKRTTKKILFAYYYLEDPNATQSAIKAGFSKKTAYSQGQRLLKDVEVQKIIKSKIEKAEITVDKVLNEIGKIAFFNIQSIYNEDGSLKKIHELPPEIAAAISSVEIIEKNGGIGADSEHALEQIKKIKMHDKSKNLENLGRYLAMFTDKIEDTTKYNKYSGLTDAELEAEINKHK